MLVVVVLVIRPDHFSFFTVDVFPQGRKLGFGDFLVLAIFGKQSFHFAFPSRLQFTIFPKRRRNARGVFIAKQHCQRGRAIFPKTHFAVRIHEKGLHLSDVQPIREHTFHEFTCFAVCAAAPPPPLEFQIPRRAV